MIIVRSFRKRLYNSSIALLRLCAIVVLCYPFLPAVRVSANQNTQAVNSSVFEEIDLKTVSTFDSEVWRKQYVPMAEKRGIMVDLEGVRTEPLVELVISQNKWHMYFLKSEKIVSETEFEVTKDDNVRKIVEVPRETGEYDRLALIPLTGSRQWLAYVHPISDSADNVLAIETKHTSLTHDPANPSIHNITGVVGYFESDDGATITLQAQSISAWDVILLGLADDKGRSVANFSENTILTTVNNSEFWRESFNAVKTGAGYKLNKLYLQYRYIEPDGTVDINEVKNSQVNPYVPYDYEVMNGTEIRTQDNLDEFDFVRQNGNEVTFDGVYIKLDRMLFVPKGKHLILEAGQTIELTNGASIFCRSTLTVNGTAERPVKVFSPDGTGDGIVVLQANSTNFGRSEANYLVCDGLDEVISGIYHLTGCVTFYESDVTIRNSQFLNNKSEDGLNIVRSDMAVKNCTWSNTYQDAFDADFCTGYFDGCYFENTGNDAFDISTSDVQVLNCTFSNIHDKACSIGEASTAYIENIDVMNAQAVIGVKDSSQVTAKHLRGEGVLFGYLAYQKKPEFGHSTTYIEDFALEGYDFDYMIRRSETFKNACTVVWRTWGN
ncbi:MAG: right-handed parallel beta-helix repeat-containing protein [Clostridiales bacterium]|jgi:hypothetical protein|nr:right-handed parallel beta-helix repeat-containing protein [Clostridiales bacterium]